MVIHELNIKNIGNFEEVNLTFSKDKINILYGQNSSGKSTIMNSLYYLLNDDRSIETRKEGSGVARVKARFYDKKQIILQKEYENESKIVFSKYNEVLEYKNFDKNKIIFLNYKVLDDIKVSKSDLYEIKRILANTELETFVDKLLENQLDEEYEAYLSIGQLKTLKSIFVLLNVKEDSIVIADDFFINVDESVSKIIISIIERQKNIQWIILTYRTNEYKEKQYNVLEINKLAKFSHQISKINCHFPSSYKPFFNVNSDEGINIKSYFTKGEELSIEETLECEFKGIYNKNPCDSIIKNGIDYVVSFLNRNKIGKILFAVSDSRIVEGISLSYEQRDEIRRRLSEEFAKIKPYISCEHLSIDFINIKENNEIRDDFFVVSIMIYPIESIFLFSNGSGEVFVKNNGGKTKLNSFEIQEELLNRIKKMKFNKSR